MDENNCILLLISLKFVPLGPNDNKSALFWVHSWSTITHFNDAYMRLQASMSWWRHQMATFSVSLALCVGNSPVTGEFPSQRPVMRSLGVFFDLRLNKRLSKQSGHRWLWRHCNVSYLWTPTAYGTMTTRKHSPTSIHLTIVLHLGRQIFFKPVVSC